MLKYKFSFREVILLLIAAVLGLCIFYYSVIYKSYTQAISKYDTSSLESDLLILSAKVTKFEEMEEYIDNHSDDYVGSVVSYDNIVNLFSDFSSDLDGNVENISISLDDPVNSDGIVRRNASISFSASNNSIVNAIITSITKSKYRVVINDVSVSTNKNSTSLAESDEVNASLSLTFFETTSEAKYEYGLINEDKQWFILLVEAILI